MLTGSFVIAAAEVLTGSVETAVEGVLTGSVVTVLEGAVNGVGGDGGSVNNALKHTYK